MPTLEELREALRSGFSLPTKNPTEAPEVIAPGDSFLPWEPPGSFPLRIEDKTHNSGSYDCAWWRNGPSYGFRIGAMDGRLSHAIVEEISALSDPQRGLIDQMHHQLAWIINPRSHNWATFEKLAEEILRWHKVVVGY